MADYLIPCLLGLEKQTAARKKVTSRMEGRVVVKA